jgi:hypothetical protein
MESDREMPVAGARHTPPALCTERIETMHSQLEQYNPYFRYMSGFREGEPT